MMKQYLTILFSLLLTLPALAQVGINTVNPSETLDVDGTARIRQIAQKTPNFAVGGDLMIIAEPNGKLSKAAFAQGTTSIDNNGDIVINAATSPTYGFAEITSLSPSNNQVYNDLDLDLGPTEANETVTVIRLSNGTGNNYDIRGLSGGTPGRHVILYNISTNGAMSLINESNTSAAANRFTTLTGNGTVGAGGVAELVYDGSSSRWIVINIRD